MTLPTVPGQASLLPDPVHVPSAGRAFTELTMLVPDKAPHPCHFKQVTLRLSFLLLKMMGHDSEFQRGLCKGSWVGAGTRVHLRLVLIYDVYKILKAHM